MEISLFSSQDEGVKKIYEAILKDGRTFVITDESLYAQSNFPDGNISLKKTVSGTTNKYFLRIKDNNVARSFAIDELLGPNTVTTNYIQDLAITNTKLADNAVTESKIKDNSIKTSHLQSESVSSDKIAKEAIKTAHFKLNSISGAILTSVSGSKIEDGTISTKKYQVGSIIESTLTDKCVTNKKLANLCVASANLQDNAVAGNHIVSAAIVNRHLTKACVKGNNIDASAIETTHIKNKAITTEKINDRAVTSNQIALKCITRDHLETTLAADLGAALKLAYGRYIVQNDIVSSANIDCNKLIANSLYIKNSALFECDVQTNGNLKVKGDVIPIGRTYHAFYQDLAEAYVPGEKLEAGDIVEIRNNKKVYKTQGYTDRVVGVISDCYASCFGTDPTEIKEGKKVAVGLIGQIPVKVFGRVVIGQYIECGKDGAGYPSFVKRSGCIGKAIECKPTDGIGYVRCLIFPN